LQHLDSESSTDSEEQFDASELDVSTLYTSLKDNPGQPNGYDASHSHALPAKLIRQGDALDLALRRRQDDIRPFRVVMLEPVQQGFLTSSTLEDSRSTQSS